jgi:hypothetical protein
MARDAGEKRCGSTLSGVVASLAEKHQDELEREAS